MNRKEKWLSLNKNDETNHYKLKCMYVCVSNEFREKIQRLQLKKEALFVGCCCFFFNATSFYTHIFPSSFFFLFEILFLFFAYGFVNFG